MLPFCHDGFVQIGAFTVLEISLCGSCIFSLSVSGSLNVTKNSFPYSSGVISYVGPCEVWNDTALGHEDVLIDVILSLALEWKACKSCYLLLILLFFLYSSAPDDTNLTC